MSDGRPYDAALNAINTLRGWGATRVRVGDIEVSFAPVTLPLEPEKPKSPEEQAAEAERYLYASADR